MSKILSDKEAAKLLADFLSARDNALYLEVWEHQLKGILKVFAFKYHELAEKTSEPGEPMKYYHNFPRKLLHEFFVKSFRNILDDLPTDVDKLKEANDALDRQHHAFRKRPRHTEKDEADGKQVSRKRRRMEKDETVDVQVSEGKCVKVEWVSKGQTEVIELTLRRPLND
ncbi:hypothetical protein B0T13DRAFT_314251 [Neurospora crassa]|nr:hypothetical protein B0T13DRAFT_314251 [Neurospora crassa]